MSDALAKVKAGLGRDAVILHTRTVKRGGLFGLGGRSLVEITATDDQRVAETRAAVRERGGGVRREGEAPAEPEHGERVGRALPAAADRGSEKSSAAVEPALRQEVLEIRSMVTDLLRQANQSRLPRVPQELIEYYTRLIGQDVAEELAVEIVERLSGRLGPDAAGARIPSRTEADCLGEELRRLVSEALPAAEPLRLTAAGRPTIVALVGPTGVGKTTTVAKLAANMKLREGKNVGLITIDAYRIAAVEQLKVYAQILDVPLAAVVTPEEMQAAVRKMSFMDLILIDTAGRSQRDDPRIAELGGLLAAARPDQVHLVLSTTASEATIREAIEKFSSLGARHLIFTKLDEALGFGVILNVLSSVNLRLSYLTAGQSVPNDIEEGSARRVAQLIVEGVVKGARG